LRKDGGTRIANTVEVAVHFAANARLPMRITQAESNAGQQSSPSSRGSQVCLRIFSLSYAQNPPTTSLQKLLATEPFRCQFRVLPAGNSGKDGCHGSDIRAIMPVAADGSRVLPELPGGLKVRRRRTVGIDTSLH
jgi:hypothetical protein